MKGQTPGEKGIQAAKSETASKCYEEKRLAIDMKLRTIQSMLISHKGRFEEDGSTDWGYVGDVGKVNDDLGEIMNFLAFSRGETGQ
jgi:hypothetical protein